MRQLAAAGLYFALVYAAGFVLGSLRELVVVPILGRVGGVLVEAPLMIVAMVLAARFVVRRLAVPPDMASRAAVGLVAFGLLMIAEAAMSGILRGWTLGQWLGHFASIEGIISLALFLLFAAMPMLVHHVPGSRETP